MSLTAISCLSSASGRNGFAPLVVCDKQLVCRT